MRHLAWLGAVPQAKSEKLADGDKRVSRIERLTEQGIMPELPPNPAPHLTNLLFEVGPAEPGGMDDAPIGWSTLRDWQAQVGLQLPPWQARLLRRLSRDYVAEARQARDEDRPAPWGATIQEKRDVVAARVRAIFGGRA